MTASAPVAVRHVSCTPLDLRQSPFVWFLVLDSHVSLANSEKWIGIAYLVEQRFDFLLFLPLADLILISNFEELRCDSTSHLGSTAVALWLITCQQCHQSA
jgi:hypothetical protein